MRPETRSRASSMGRVWPTAATVISPESTAQEQGFRPQPMGFCLNGHPCQPRWLLIPMVRAWQNLYGPMSAVSSLAPSLLAFIVKGDRK
jgi:hypothetical protein